VIAIIGGLVLAWTGFQPPNDKVLYVTVGLAVALVVLWYGLERRRFAGPPTGEQIVARQGSIAQIEANLEKGAAD